MRHSFCPKKKNQPFFESIQEGQEFLISPVFQAHAGLLNGSRHEWSTPSDFLEVLVTGRKLQFNPRPLNPRTPRGSSFLGDARLCSMQVLLFRCSEAKGSGNISTEFLGRGVAMPSKATCGGRTGLNVEKVHSWAYIQRNISHI
jgi:hypothetical protein